MNILANHNTKITNVSLIMLLMLVGFHLACGDSSEPNDEASENETMFVVESIYYDQGIEFANSGDYQSAIDSFDRAVEVKPDFAEVFYNRGFAYVKLGEYTKAIDDFTQVILLKPDRPEFLTMAFYNRGNVYNLLEEYNKGIDDYDKAIELNPDFVEAYYYRGNANIKIREYEKALVDYNSAIAINPNYENALNNRKTLLDSGILVKD